MSLRRSVLDAVGGFDTGLGRTADRPLGCEETELCIRAAELFPRGRFVLEPQAVVHHAVPRARAAWSYFRARCRAEGVSKAWVAGRVGPTAALSAEQAYVSRVLPAGVVRHLGDAVRGDRSAAGRAGAIVAGLAYTAGSYVRTRAALEARVDKLRAPKPDPSAARSEPMIPLVVDLSEPLPAVDARRTGGDPYGSAVCLVTRAGDPAGQGAARPSEGAPVGGAARKSTARGAGHAHHRRRRAQRCALPAARDRGGGHPGPAGPAAGVPAVDLRWHARPGAAHRGRQRTRRATRPPISSAAWPRTSRGWSTSARTGPDSPAPTTRPSPMSRPALVAFTDDDVVVDAAVAGTPRRRLRERRRDRVRHRDDRARGSWKPFPSNGSRATSPTTRACSAGCSTPAGTGPRTRSSRSRPARSAPGPTWPSGPSFLRRHGGFDNALGTGTVALGGDDLAAFYDVIATGHRLVYEPAAIVLHRHHRQYAGLRRQTYGYGAGLGAHLTRCLLREPRMALVLLRHAATARRRATHIIAPPTVAGLPPYPADLSRQQLRGLVSGPWRYLVSRRRLRRETA